MAARSQRSWPTILLGGVLGVCLCTLPAWNQGNVAAAAERAVSEYDIKAAFLLNFIRFTEWPPSETDPGRTFSICLLEDDPFDGALNRLVAGEKVNARPIAVKTIRRWDTSCDVLFVPHSARDPYRIVRRIGSGVLTVGEDPGFLRDGGMINFVVTDRRVHFDVNQRAAQAASLRISSRLLSVARSVLQ